MPTGLKINCRNPEEANVVLLCAPYDRTASFRKGTVKGPAAIVNALKYQMETYDRIAAATPAPDRKVALRNLPGLNRCSPEAMVQRVKDEYSKHCARDAFVVLLGGEHSVTVGALQAMSEYREAKKVTILQIDAHFDLRPDDSDYSDTPHGAHAHSTVMRRAHEMGFNCLHVGVRAYSREEIDYARRNGLKFFEWGLGPVPSQAEIVDAISTPFVYLTIDADGLDPAHMPATGTPVQGGLEWYYALNLLREIFARKQVIGCDIVEVAPRRDDVLTEYGAAQLCYTMLALREVHGEQARDH